MNISIFRRRLARTLLAIFLLTGAGTLPAAAAGRTLLNVSYDATREL